LQAFETTANVFATCTVAVEHRLGAHDASVTLRQSGTRILQGRFGLFGRVFATLELRLDLCEKLPRLGFERFELTEREANGGRLLV